MCSGSLHRNGRIITSSRSIFDGELVITEYILNSKFLNKLTI